MDSMKENGLPVTFSIGAVSFLTFLGGVEDMLQKADELMYFVKSHGKSNIRYETVAEVPAVDHAEPRRAEQD
jgi:PleD family two-component response regulator